jgi:hypothetical protein
MKLKNKIMIVLGLCFSLCIGSYFIITKMFENLEKQLMEKCRIEALTGSRVMAELISFMITKNIINESDIFDTNYIEIPGTNPKKYHTKYDRLFDKYIQKIQDEFLLDPDVEYAVLVDKNGYVPTHNSKYSKPETNNYAIDLIYSRSKRNFSNYISIKKVLEYRGNDTIKVLYHRDTGEIIWNIGAPVKLRGKDWGSFVIGVSLKRMNEIKNQMLIMIVTIMFVILSLTLLALFAIIPKKLLASEHDEPIY